MALSVEQNVLRCFAKFTSKASKQASYRPNRLSAPLRIYPAKDVTTPGEPARTAKAAERGRP